MTLLVSDLPQALWQAMAGDWPSLLVWLQVGGLLLLIALTWSVQRLCRLRSMFALLAILVVGQRLERWLDVTPDYVQLGDPSGLLLRLAQFEGARVLVVTAVVVALLAMSRRRQEFYLAAGDIARWRLPGVTIGLIVMALTFLFFGYPLPALGSLFAIGCGAGLGLRIV